MTDDTPTWLITGCSTGFGKALVEHLISLSWNVIATARNPEDLAEISAGRANVLPLALDVTKPDQIAAAVDAAKAHFGKIDVLVNNAGYGYQSTVEEGDDAAIRTLFDTNVFGLFAVTRAVLPLMRARGKGFIVNITSISGLVGLPGSGHYSASKFAVEGWSEALAAECAPLGIRVTCIEPGPFRTDFAGRSLRQTPTAIDDYVATAGARQQRTRATSGTQAGDPVRAAAAIVDLYRLTEPPSHLLLGGMAVDLVLPRLRDKIATLERYRDVALSADFVD